MKRRKGKPICSFEDYIAISKNQDTAVARMTLVNKILREMMEPMLVMYYVKLMISSTLRIGLILCGKVWDQQLLAECQ